jgi:hypothetical protein
MYITEIKNRNSPPAVLLRESYREGDKVKTCTLASLSALPNDAIAVLKLSLKGEKLVLSKDKAMNISASHHHGQVQAVMDTMRRLGLAELLHSRPSAECDCVMAMSAARVIEPDTKLATTRWWHNTTLP